MRVFGFLILSIMLLAAPCGAQANDESRAAYEIKAAYLYNFVKYIEWPEETFNTVNDPFIIAILGENPFGSELEALKSKQIRGRPVQLRYVMDPAAVRGSHLVYIGPSEWWQMKTILLQVPTTGVLTVSGMPDFNTLGGMIRFVEKDNRVRFSINLLQGKKAKLRISSRLLQLALDVLD